ncbi:ArsR/SmtB family transcription factor [Jidongwangia harbinensis]|uniref:ArsR/SmtB family transcription factor n=1 Tax=Jidongwangia harbinensis TaxID=2878561 RepID=UPI001CDA0387|nr:metalloregulator ArsR/SmtB family transcription factor [Jidongwangia harbinensis]MCA2215980.1 metalloregulator ArsR/SmtB family transcription factor [Jidongwangia harbinensis]
MSADVDAVLLGRAVEILRGMAYEHRLHILVLLRAGECTPAALAGAVPVHPTAVAHHLRSLLDAGLVRRRRRGRVVTYSLRHPSTGPLIDEILRYAAGTG